MKKILIPLLFLATTTVANADFPKASELRQFGRRVAECNRYLIASDQIFKYLPYSSMDVFQRITDGHISVAKTYYGKNKSFRQGLHSYTGEPLRPPRNRAEAEQREAETFAVCHADNLSIYKI